MLLAPLLLALLSGVALPGDLAESVVRGGRQAVPLFAGEQAASGNALVSSLASLPDAGGVLLVLQHEGRIPAAWTQDGERSLTIAQRGAVLAAWRRLPERERSAVLEGVAADPARAGYRGTAIRLLGETGRAAHLDLLFRLAPTLSARAEDTVRRREVLSEALTRILVRDPWALEGLRRAFDEHNELWLGAILKAVEAAPIEGRLEFLTSILQHVPTMTRPLLASLARLGREARHPVEPSVLREVRAFLDQVDPALVVAAARTAGALEDHDAVRRLVLLLDEDDANVRAEAGRALLEITGRWLPDSDRWARWLAAETRWWHEESEEIFRSFEHGEAAKLVRELATLGGRRYRRHVVAREVLACLGRPEEGIRLLACSVLGQLGSSVAEPALEDLAARGDDAVSRAARQALARIRGGAAEATPTTAPGP